MSSRTALPKWSAGIEASSETCEHCRMRPLLLQPLCGAILILSYLGYGALRDPHPRLLCLGRSAAKACAATTFRKDPSGIFKGAKPR
jgi:hypothetical protein